MKGLLFNILLLGAHFGFAISSEHQRIINGQFAVAKQFPYQVIYDVLYLGTQVEWRKGCGGTLISKRIILTAAHCFDKTDTYAIKVYFGAVDISNSSEVGQQQLVVKRSNVVLHKEYDSSVFHNDIALIKLPIDVAFDEYISPAKLPEPDIMYDLSKAIASGWGAVEDNETDIYQPKLKYFHTSIISHAECRKWWQKGVTMKIVASQICFVSREDSSCSGDSGGPVTVRHNGEVVLIGITSCGSEKCSVNTPTVYTRVASYLNWIHENAGAHNLDE